MLRVLASCTATVCFLPNVVYLCILLCIFVLFDTTLIAWHNNRGQVQGEQGVDCVPSRVLDFELEMVRMGRLGKDEMRKDETREKIQVEVACCLL